MSKISIIRISQKSKIFGIPKMQAFSRNNKFLSMIKNHMYDLRQQEEKTNKKGDF